MLQSYRKGEKQFCSNCQPISNCLTLLRCSYEMTSHRLFNYPILLNGSHFNKQITFNNGNSECFSHIHLTVTLKPSCVHKISFIVSVEPNTRWWWSRRRRWTSSISWPGASTQWTSSGEGTWSYSLGTGSNSRCSPKRANDQQPSILYLIDYC